MLHIPLRVCTYMCLSVCVCMCVNLSLRVRACVCVCIRACVCVCVCVCICACVCVYMFVSECAPACVRAVYSCQHTLYYVCKSTSKCVYINLLIF